MAKPFPSEYFYYTETVMMMNQAIADVRRSGIPQSAQWRTDGAVRYDA